MILHHYIWGDIDIDIVEEVAPHFLIAKHYGNLALFCRLTKHQNHYFRNSDKSFYSPCARKAHSVRGGMKGALEILRNS